VKRVRERLTVVIAAIALAMTGGCTGPAPDGGADVAPSAAAPLVPDFRTGTYATLYQALDAQAKGLLDGDEAAWLAVVDPENERLVAKYRQLYLNLRDAGITEWRHHSVLEPSTTADGKTSAALYIAFCFENMQRCKPWDVTRTGKEAANAWSVTYVMTERSGSWVLLDDTRYGLGMRRAPGWVPKGPKYDQNWTEPVG
jgi:hypothetical protein